MPLSGPIVTGYYRYTDIMFEWHQVIPDPTERSALKAFLSNISMTDPKNPLRTEGDKGLELYIGVLRSNNQQRLMFSSTQAEYIRYWLHAMGLTKQLLPLPSTDYLLNNTTLLNVTSVFFKDSKELKKAVTNVTKNNKRLKGTDSGLISVRQMFEKVRHYWEDKAGTYLSIDFETWEMEHQCITEFGWSYLQWKEDNEVAANGHYIIEENQLYTNGKYVPNMRDRYRFGNSEIVKKAELKRIIQRMINDFSSTGPLFLVFHDHSQDIKSLESVDAPLDGLSFILPNITPDGGIFVIDTSCIFAALEGDISEKRSLEKMCQLLKIPTEYTHNAGNDAHYTLLAFRSMASGNQVDAQREQRWPNQTHRDQNGSSVKVEFKPWEEDSDYSDMEGAFAHPANVGEPAKGTEVERSLW